ncbi:MAG: hypothetical protein OXD29_00405, partial [Roseovarius sp.]|nr:hypothetical protein [Roseovarius sp.]
DLVRGVAFPDWETLYRALAGEVGFVPVRDGPWRQRRLPHRHPQTAMSTEKKAQMPLAGIAGEL